LRLSKENLDCAVCIMLSAEKTVCLVRSVSVGANDGGCDDDEEEEEDEEEDDGGEGKVSAAAAAAAASLTSVSTSS
jgi:hypothetical protein